jgi:hypothetical protein
MLSASQIRSERHRNLDPFSNLDFWPEALPPMHRQQHDPDHVRDMLTLVETFRELSEFSENRPPQIKEIVSFPSRRVLHSHHRRGQIIAAHGFCDRLRA